MGGEDREKGYMVTRLHGNLVMPGSERIAEVTRLQGYMVRCTSNKQPDIGYKVTWLHGNMVTW